eukprot:gene26438-34608_t
MNEAGSTNVKRSGLRDIFLNDHDQTVDFETLSDVESFIAMSKGKIVLNLPKHTATAAANSKTATATPVVPAGNDNRGRFVPDTKAENVSSTKHVVNKKEIKDVSKTAE